MAPVSVTCVGAMVVKGNSLLAIRQGRGHPLEGQWTFPWGRLEDGESPSSAAIREVKEEAGVIASVQGLLGVQELPSPWDGWNAIIYLCRHEHGTPQPDSRETDAAKYVTLAGLEKLGEPIEPWSEWLMKHVLQNQFKVIESSEANPYYPSVGFL